MEIINEIKNKILSSKNVAVFGHTSVDGDCIGSMCAIAMLLNNLGKHVEIFVDSDIPQRFACIPFYENINKTELDINKFDLLISADTSTKARHGEYGEIFVNFENTILIDHHMSNTKFAKTCYVEPHAPACGQVLFNLLTKCEFEISEDMATALLGAIISDTNNLTNNDVTNETFEVVSKLLSLNANFSKIIYDMSKKKTINQLRVASFMAKNIKLKDEVAILIVRKKDFKKLNCKQNDISKFLTLITDIEGAKITAIFKEKDKNFWSISFRSLTNYNVDAVASHFGGGGHINAAGCLISAKLRSLKKQVLEICKQQIAIDEEKDAK